MRAEEWTEWGSVVEGPGVVELEQDSVTATDLTGETSQPPPSSTPLPSLLLPSLLLTTTKPSPHSPTLSTPLPSSLRNPPTPAPPGTPTLADREEKNVSGSACSGAAEEAAGVLGKCGSSSDDRGIPAAGVCACVCMRMGVGGCNGELLPTTLASCADPITCDPDKRDRATDVGACNPIAPIPRDVVDAPVAAAAAAAAHCAPSTAFWNNGARDVVSASSNIATNVWWLWWWQRRLKRGGVCQIE